MAARSFGGMEKEIVAFDGRLAALEQQLHALARGGAITVEATEVVTTRSERRHRENARQRTARAGIPPTTVIPRGEFEALQRENGHLRKELTALVALTATLAERLIALDGRADARTVRALSAVRAATA